MGKGIMEQISKNNKHNYKKFDMHQLESMLKKMRDAKDKYDEAYYDWELVGKSNEIKHPRRSKDFIGKKDE